MNTSKKRRVRENKDLEKVTITLPKKFIDTLREHNINISELTEKRLKNVIRKLRAKKIENHCNELL